MVTCSLDALKKPWEEERNENKNYLQQKGDRKAKDQDDEILGFDFVFVGQNNTDFNFTSWYYCRHGNSPDSRGTLPLWKL